MCRRSDKQRESPNRDGDRHEGAAGESQLAPFDDSAGFGILQDRAVLVKPPRRQLLDDTGIARPKPDQIAILADQHFWHTGGARQFGVLKQVQRFAVHRDQQMRAHP